MREVFLRSGETGRHLLELDWTATPLGDPEEWSQGLRATVRMMLASRFSMWMAWGPELTFLCNDAYKRDTLGTKFPWALGRPAPDVWSEVWPAVRDRVERVLADGESTWDANLQLFLERSGYREETYHTFSYSPLYDDAGATAGLLCVVAETTDDVVARRRLALLRDLGVAVADKLTEREKVATASRVLAAATQELPFHLLYLNGDEGARLAGSGGIAQGHPAAPALVTRGAGLWSLPDAADGPVLVDGLSARFDLPPGLPSDRAAVVRLRGGETTYGFLVVGLNPYRPYDAGYADFLAMISGHVAAAITDGRAYDAERERAAIETRRTRLTRVELERSQALLDQAQRVARVGSWSFVVDEGRLDVSPEFLRIVDRDRAALERLGYPGFVSEIVHPDDEQLARTVLEEAAAGDQIEFETRILRRDGEVVHASLRAEVEPRTGGGLVARGSLQDMTTRRRTEEAMALAYATAEVAAREHQIAADLQSSLLPASTFDLKHLDVATFYRPGQEGTQVGGDWYDVIELAGGRTALVMGDVMGHGVNAAAVMGQLRTAVRAYARLGMPPSALIESVDLLVWDMFPDQIVTCVYAEFDPDDLTVRIVNAGHPPPMVRGADGARRVQTETHPPLGLGRPFGEPTVVSLAPGDTVLLYTDGLVERRGRDIETGIEALQQALGGPALPLTEVPDAVVSEMLPDGPEDDVALLVAQVPHVVA